VLALRVVYVIEVLRFVMCFLVVYVVAESLSQCTIILFVLYVKVYDV
jgi:hypothetical protein